ncbi:hypothetical protein [Wenzhouxiangella limi]|uniref:Uncharacterized protein n=1 Tax=Wenzhouxiangella limi TaxID=2707351 RepID=A0A845V1G4_9GAMM|nr:hypothetical protein [Wenzhouxiangella limi]NDY94121.1 hypothetical protein [Wenzhouxiangella limi]
MIEKDIEGFEKLGIDADTQLKFRKKIVCEGLSAVHEQWSYDGILGESLIFLIGDTADLDDAALESLVRQSGHVNARSSVTISRKGSDYVFVNFNFVS